MKAICTEDQCASCPWRKMGGTTPEEVEEDRLAAAVFLSQRPHLCHSNTNQPCRGTLIEKSRTVPMTEGEWNLFVQYCAHALSTVPMRPPDPTDQLRQEIYEIESFYQHLGVEVPSIPLTRQEIQALRMSTWRYGAVTDLLREPMILLGVTVHHDKDAPARRRGLLENPQLQPKEDEDDYRYGYTKNAAR